MRTLGAPPITPPRWILFGFIRYYVNYGVHRCTWKLAFISRFKIGGKKLARSCLDQNKTLTFIGLHCPERNTPICTSTTGQHETVLALVHDPAGVIANAECSREEDLAPSWQISLAAHICIGVIVQNFSNRRSPFLSGRIL